MRQQELRKEEEGSAKVSDFFKSSLGPLFMGGMTMSGLLLGITLGFGPDSTC